MTEKSDHPRFAFRIESTLVKDRKTPLSKRKSLTFPNTQKKTENYYNLTLKFLLKNYL